MVGFSPEELMAGSGEAIEAPYWPTELAHEYQQRQARRLAGGMPPREGFESVFMRKDGTRFPVLIFEAPLINAQRVQTGWMSAFIDISEQRRIEELSRASQERLQATAGLEVGTPGAVVAHLDEEAIVIERHPDVDDARARVSSRVGERLADQEVGGRLDLGVGRLGGPLRPGAPMLTLGPAAGPEPRTKPDSCS